MDLPLTVSVRDIRLHTNVIYQASLGILFTDSDLYKSD